MDLTPSRDPLGITGTLVAEKYRIEGLIGEGGFSLVYKAEHTIWNQPVAIKCFKILSSAPPEYRAQLLDSFIQEGKLMTSLSSRSAAIVQARDVGTFTTGDGQWVPYMVLEWLEGKPLDLVLHEEKFLSMPARSLQEVMALLEPVAIALELVHRKNVAHRDIKPANIFIIGDPRGMGAFAKVLDFGIAKVMAESAALATALQQTGHEITAFTPNYGAPEQFSRSHGATGPWTDVYAMALILIEMLRGGVAVLEGDDYLQLAIASRDPARRPTPRAFGLAVTDDVEAVFSKALAVSPADRYPTMGGFWTALYHAVFAGATWSAGTGLLASSPPTASSRLPVSVPGGIPSPGMLPSLSPQTPPAPSLASAPPGIPTQNTGTVSAIQPAPRSSSKALLIFAAIFTLALGGGGFAAYRMLGRPSPDGPAPPPIASAPAPSASTAVAAAPARRTQCPDDTVLVPGGKFFMGSDDPAFKLWQPAHKVTIDTFCIDIYEVTAEAYKECSDQGECKRPEVVPSYPKAENVKEDEHERQQATFAEFCNFGKPGRERHPINCVSWALADGYCKFRKKRLPTEAEWEYAARGSDGRKFPWGEEPGDVFHMNACGKECSKWETEHKLSPTPRMFDEDDGYPGTAPVGSFPKGKTKFGAHDFVGNVWEWTADWFETYKPDEAVNPVGAPAGDRKAIRGGGFNGGFELWLNPAFRYHQLATASAHAIGFRCALTL
jgi:formylglycine-generating enzyme required for sulfatase activity/tRNA A-37 threonylcarbamoyl transferase component Bud32